MAEKVTLNKRIFQALLGFLWVIVDLPGFSAVGGTVNDAQGWAAQGLRSW
jgi:hypothetical protein